MKKFFLHFCLGLALLVPQFLWASGFVNLGPSSIDCEENLRTSVNEVVDELGIPQESRPNLPPHFTMEEFESLMEVIEGEEHNDTIFLLHGYFRHKEILVPGEDFYENYRFQVLGLIRQIGIPESKMEGLPLHFTKSEFDAMSDLTSGEEYDGAIQLIRGFVSHKVQINPNDVCVAESAGAQTMTYSSNSQETNSVLKPLKDLPAGEESKFLRYFPKFRRPW